MRKEFFHTSETYKHACMAVDAYMLKYSTPLTPPPIRRVGCRCVFAVSDGCGKNVKDEGNAAAANFGDSLILVNKARKV